MSSSTQSSTSAGESSGSGSSQSPTTTSNTFSVSSTFQPPPSTTSTMDRPPDNNRGQSGGGDPMFGNTSASLYLYTFLATLILLLGVSAAIVARSLILRRRHRRMIEEAIRNGTYVPPLQGPWVTRRGGMQVDLNKKPVMWEAWLGGGYVCAKGEGESGDVGVHPLEHEKEKGVDVEWNGIMPMSLQLLKQPVHVGLSNSNNASSASLNRNGTANPSSTSLPNPNTTNASTPGSGLLGRIRTRFGWRSTPPPSQSQSSSPSDSPNPPPIGPPGIGGLGPGGVGIVPPWARVSESTSMFRYSYPYSQQRQEDELPPQTLTGNEKSAKVRVSVMIAMPSRHPVIPSRKELDGQEPRQGQEVEEELPHLEVGSVEVDVGGDTSDESPARDEGDREKEDVEMIESAGAGAGDLKGKRSMSGGAGGEV